MTTPLTAERILERIRKTAVATFGCKEEEIRSETTAADINGWDSLSHTLFIMAVEREFSVRLDLSRVVRLENVGDLVQEVARACA